MPSGKTKTDTKATGTTSQSQAGQFNTANTFERLPGAESADIAKAREQKFRVDPTIGARVGEAQRTLKSSFNNPVGGFYTPAQRDAIMRSQSRELFQQSGAQTRAGQYDVNNQDAARNQFIAGLTAPPLVQTSSSGTSSGTSSGQSTGTNNTVNTTPFSSKIIPALQEGARTAAIASAGSDVRLKDDLRTIDKVGQLRGVIFNWAARAADLGYPVGQAEGGVVADEVEKVFPELVQTHRGYKHVNYVALTGLLVEAVREMAIENGRLS